MEPKNHPFRKENDHANTSQDYSSGMVGMIFPDNSCGHKIKKTTSQSIILSCIIPLTVHKSAQQDI